VKKTGAPNDAIVEMICLHLGWGGDLRTIYGAPPQEGLVQVRVEANQWNGKTYYNASWVQSKDKDPGATPAAAASEESVGKMAAKHGKAFLAAAAKVKRAPAKAEAAVDPADIPF